MKTFTIILSILVSSLISVEAKTSPVSYVELLSLNVAHEGELKWIVEHVEASNVEEPAEMSKLLGKYSEDFRRIGHFQISAILDLFAGGPKGKHSVSCLSYEAKRFIDLATVSFGNIKNYLALVESNQQPEHNRKLFNLLIWHSNNTWRKCLSDSAITSMFASMSQKIDPEVENTFDKLILARSNSDKELASEAEKIDFTKGKLDGRGMVDAMAANLKQAKPSAQVFPNMLFEFITSKCRSLYPILSDFFDGYNLSRALFPNEIESREERLAKFKKLNEYSRLCNQVLKPATSQISATNIAKNTPKTFKR